MSVERCDRHDLHYDTDLKLCCPLCEEAGVEEIVKLRDALATSEKERVRWQKYYETGLKVDAELKAKLAQVTAERELYKEMRENTVVAANALEKRLIDSQARCTTLEAALDRILAFAPASADKVQCIQRLNAIEATAKAALTPT
jgi:hypothetical protein